MTGLFDNPQALYPLLGMLQGFTQAAMPQSSPLSGGAVLGQGVSGLFQGMMMGQQAEDDEQRRKLGMLQAQQVFDQTNAQRMLSGQPALDPTAFGLEAPFGMAPEGAPQAGQAALGPPQPTSPLAAAGQPQPPQVAPFGAAPGGVTNPLVAQWAEAAGMDPQEFQLLMVAYPEMAQQLAAAGMKPPDAPEGMVYDKTTGGYQWVPGYLEGKAALAQAGRAVTTVNNVGESAFNKELGTLGAQSVKEAVDAGNTAASTLATLDQIDAILPKLQTGSLAGLEREVGALAQALGIDPQSLNLQDPGLAQSLTAAATKARLDLLQNLKGAVTDREQVMFEKALPGLSNTPEGNQLISGMMRATAERAVAKAELMKQWAAVYGNPLTSKNEKGQTFDQVWNSFAESNPLITPDLQAKIDALSGGAPTQAVTPAPVQPPPGFNLVQ